MRDRRGHHWYRTWSTVSVRTPHDIKHGRKARRRRLDDGLHCLHLNTSRRQPKGIYTAISNNAEVGRTGDGYPGIKVWRVLDRIGIEALGTKLEH
jgi:hypothetical protein